ncbi:MAG: polysaccharide ABC transporter ATP-binding protein [Pseudomonadota bacterium]
MTLDANLAIRAEGLGKSYRLRQREDGFQYQSLRDSLSQGPAMIGRAVARKLGRGGGPDRGHETFWAVNDLDFEIEQGQVMGILGRNGAGKSTLLKLLSRITEPTTGRVEVRGRIASLLEVGTGFHPELTGRENIYLNGAILGMRREEVRKRFDEIVAFAEVERFLETPVKRYSSGMYVRLAFSVAAHLEPEILVVDEVLAVGDKDFQKKCIGRMSQVSGEGRTVIFVSHNIQVLRELCTHGLVLEQGRAIFSGEIGRAIEHYAKSGGQSGEKLYSPTALVSRVAVWQEGARIVLELNYNDPEKKLRVPNFGFIIHDADGRPVMGHGPVLEGRFNNLTYPATGVVRATIEQPALLDGSYLVSIFLGDEYTTYFSDEHCITLEAEGMMDALQQSPQRVGPVYPLCRYEFIGEGLHTRLEPIRVPEG